MNRRLLVAAFVVVLTVTAAAVAHAYWRGSGNGSSSGTTSTTVAVALSPATPSAALYPGGLASVALTVSNPSTFTVHIGSLLLDTGRGTAGFAIDAGHSGCAESTLSFTTQTNGTGWTVPAKAGAVNGVLPITLPGALAMAVGAANACQGANITVYLVVGS